MKTFVVYDITDDRTRNKIFQTCKDYGLTHIQYSAFFGELNHNRREELSGRLKRALGQKEGKIVIVPVCDKDLRLLLEICYPEEISPGIAEIAESAGSYLIR
ncbi:MAG: CRISPR-associated endonuclease Cas2 [Bacillota bacterium]